MPGRVFDLFRNIQRFRPAHPVVIAVHQQHLSSLLLGGHGMVARGPPAAAAPHPVCPQRHHPHPSPIGVYHNGRVPYPVVRTGQRPVTRHIHNPLHRFPGLPAVRAAAQPHLNILLQVNAVVVAHVIHSEQRPLRRGGQPRDAIGVYAVITGRTHCHGQSMPVGRMIAIEPCSPFPVQFHPSQCRTEHMRQGRAVRHRQTDIKIVGPREEFLVKLQGHGTRRHGVFGQPNGISRVVEDGLSAAILGHGMGQPRGCCSRAEHRGCPCVKHPYSLDIRQVFLRKIDRHTGHPFPTHSGADPQVEDNVVGTAHHYRNGRFMDKNGLRSGHLHQHAAACHQSQKSFFHNGSGREKEWVYRCLLLSVQWFVGPIKLKKALLLQHLQISTREVEVVCLGVSPLGKNTRQVGQVVFA